MLWKAGITRKDDANVTTPKPSIPPPPPNYTPIARKSGEGEERNECVEGVWGREGAYTSAPPL